MPRVGWAGPVPRSSDTISADQFPAPRSMTSGGTPYIVRAAGLTYFIASVTASRIQSAFEDEEANWAKRSSLSRNAVCGAP